VFKGNLLFFSEVYENMHNRGLAKSVPGVQKGCFCIIRCFTSSSGLKIVLLRSLKFI